MFDRSIILRVPLSADAGVIVDVRIVIAITVKIVFNFNWNTSNV